jgi:Sulfotransferase family
VGPPFFIVGNDRSGTTMLRLALDHGGVAIPPESMFLVDFAPVRRRGGLDDPEAAAAFLRRVWSHPRVRAWGLAGDPPAVPPGLGHEEAYRFAVEAPFHSYAAARGKPRWADKTPLYLAYIDELAAVWPDARFVVLVRDGRDVALSLLRVPFGPNNVWAAARFWAQGIRLGLEAAERHPGCVLTVRYEDVVADPAPELRRTCEFLGLAYDDAMLGVGINTGSVGNWRRAMSAGAQRLFASVAGAELERMGYDLGPYAGEAAPLGLRARVYAAHDAALRVANFVRLRLVQERGREVGYVLKRKLVGAWR